MTSRKDLDLSYEKEVISDASDPEATQRYYATWCKKEADAVAVGGDARANAAAPISDQFASPDTCNYYSRWSGKYEEDMVMSDYQGPMRLSEAFIRLKLPTSVRLLDVLAGTGKLAGLIRPHGYTNIDAIDGSADMLKLAKERQLYSHYFQALLGRGKQAPISDGTYDAIITSGSFAPGHLYPDVFPELLRLVKKGGLICWAMRQGYETSSPEFAGFDDQIDALIQLGSWEYFCPKETIKQYLLGSDGFVYIMKKL